MIEGRASILPELIASTFKITSASFMPVNSSAASEIILQFSFILKETGGKYIQISFDKSRFVPLYSELLPLEISVNDKVSSIVDLSVKQSEFYFSPI